MKDFVTNGIRDVSVALLLGSVIAMLVQRSVSPQSATVLGLAVATWLVALALKARD